MNVKFKTIAIELEIKNKGIELSVVDPKGGHRGDLWVTKSELIWCKGRTARKNGKRINWEDFMEYMEDR